MKLVVGFLGVVLTPGLVLAQVPSGGSSNVPTGNAGSVLQSPIPSSNTLNPSVHLAKMLASSAPNECFTGDSTMTLTPNPLVPTDILYYGLTRRLREDNPTKAFTFNNYAIGSQTWNTLNGVASQNWPSWYFDQTLPWLPYIQALNCTSIFIELGVNDQAAFTPSAVQSVLNKIVGWGTAPSGWAASTAYTAGTVIEDSNSKLEIVKTAGTSGSGSHPTWPSTVGTATTDGGVTWELLSAVAYVPSIPDIVLLTNQNANPNAGAPFNTPAVIIGTVAAASYQRTLALGGATTTSFVITGLPAIGLIDLGRMFTEVFNGYDPVEPYFTQSITSPTSTITSFPYTLPTTPGGDFDLTFVVQNGSAYTGSSYIQVSTSSDYGVTQTYLTMLPVSGSNALAAYVNNATGAGSPAGSVSAYNGTVWSTGNNTIEVSAKGTHLFVTVNGVTIFDVITARFVAQFTPVIQFVNPPSSPSVIVNSYNISNYRTTTALISAANCWGSIGGISGGNGINHDASPCMNAVNMMVLDSLRFH